MVQPAWAELRVSQSSTTRLSHHMKLVTEHLHSQIRITAVPFAGSTDTSVETVPQCVFAKMVQLEAASLRAYLQAPDLQITRRIVSSQPKTATTASFHTHL